MEVPEEIKLKFTPEARKQIGALMERSGLDLNQLFQHILATFDALQSYQGDGAVIKVHHTNGAWTNVPSFWDTRE